MKDTQQTRTPLQCYAEKGTLCRKMQTVTLKRQTQKMTNRYNRKRETDRHRHRQRQRQTGIKEKDGETDRHRYRKTVITEKDRQTQQHRKKVKWLIETARYLTLSFIQ